MPLDARKTQHILNVVPKTFALGTSFTGVVYVADTTTATSAAVAAAPKYEIIEALPVGVVPGGTHVRALLRRLR